MRDPSVQMPKFVDFIKIDTQGSELHILQGADETLRNHVIGLEVEVLFARLYDVQPVFRDVDAFLTERGFSLFKLRRQEWVRRTYAQRPHLSAGQLVFGDALYLRDPLSPHAAWRPQGTHQIEALVLVALLYDLHDFALELLSAPLFTSLLNVEALRRCVVQRSTRLNSLIERLRVVRARCGSGDELRRYAPRWSRGDCDFYSAI